MAQKIAFTDDKGMGQKGEPLTNLPPSGKFLSVLFSTLNGEQSNLIETNEGGYFLIRPDEILESRKLSFPEAKNLVEKIWREEQVHKAAMIKAKKIGKFDKSWCRVEERC
jgi:peptidyl-prolyl cis-trans isomerase D